MAYVGEALVAELALMGRGRRPLDPTPNPTSDSDPPRLLTESCGPSQNRVAPRRIVVYAWLMGTPRKALRTPAQSPSPEKVTTRQKGGAGRNRPRPKSEVSLRGEPLAPWEGDWVQLRGWGVKRGVAMSHAIL